MTFDRLGPTGNVVKGHVLDCSKKALEEKLRDYDPLLYIRWNPRKRSGQGIWEVRRRAEKNTYRRSTQAYNEFGQLVRCTQGDVYEFDGFTIVWPKAHELDVISHVLDVQYLNYNILTKLKAMDTWQVDNFAGQFEYDEQKAIERANSKIQEELNYGIKHHKKEMQVIKEYMQSNVNSPADLVRYWQSQPRKG